MKLLHTTMLTTKEFNQLSEKIIDSFYKLNPDMQDLYDIHINFVGDEWVIDFLPLQNNLPVIKIDTYVEEDRNGGEVLKVIPTSLVDMPDKLGFKDEDRSYDLCMNYVAIFEFVLALYDFEYKLN